MFMDWFCKSRRILLMCDRLFLKTLNLLYFPQILFIHSIRLSGQLYLKFSLVIS